jgi:hypothetical protein
MPEAEPNQPTPETPEVTSESTTPEQEVFPKEYVQKLREEAAKYRTQLREQEAKAEAARQEALKRAPLEEQLTTLQSELEAARKAATENATRARQASLKAQLAGKVLDADAAMRLLDDDFVGEDDAVKLDAFLERYAFLKPTSSKPSVPSANATTSRDGTTLTPDDFRGKSPAWIERNLPRLKKLE